MGAAARAMHKDANLRRRNALVIPGGLLAVHGLIGLAYVALLRGDDGSCGDASLVVFAGACRSAYLLLAVPLVVGLGLVAAGTMAARSTATCRDGHGSWTHFALAFLVSLVVLPLVALLAAPSVLGPDAAITRGTVDYPVTTVLAGLTGVGLLMFIPFALLYYSQRRANPCCREKGCFDPCFCDEGAAPVEPLAPAEDASTPVTGSPGSTSAGAALPVGGQGEPSPTAGTEWAVVPEEAPAQAWEVVPDEPKEASAEGGSDRPDPPLATRPTDPAAPPADAMAVAAKWAEEDEEALKELEGTASGRRREKSAAKAAKKAAKAKTKAAKKGKE